jgi:hypothetical protein
MDCTVLTISDLDKGQHFCCFADHEGGIEAACTVAVVKKMQNVQRLLDGSKNRKPTQKQQKDLVEFARLFVALNQILQFNLVCRMLPVFEQVQSLLKQHNLDSLLTVSQAVRLHLPRKELAAFVLKVASHEALLTPPPKYCKGYDTSKPRKRLRNEESRIAVAFLMFDTKLIHPLVQLLYDVLVYLLSEHPELDVYIMALQEPDPSDQDPLLRQLCAKFTEKERWLQVEPKDVREMCKTLALDLLVDTIGGQQGGLPSEFRPLPGEHAFAIAHYLNQAWPMFDSRYYDFFFADATMQKALLQQDGQAGQEALPSPGEPAEAGLPPEHEQTVVFSCWQPPLSRHYLDRLSGFPASQRKSGDPFNVYATMSLDRLDEIVLSLLFHLALKISEIVLCFELLPLACAAQVDAMAIKFAKENGMDPDHFLRSRVVYLEYLPLDKHLIRLRNMHFGFNGGFYPGHTTQGALNGAGVPVLAIGGILGDFGSASWVGESINSFCGLGALNVPFGPFDEMLLQIINIFKQMVEDEVLRTACSTHLETMVRERRSFFCDRRVGDDIVLLVSCLCNGGFSTMKTHGHSATCPPEPELLSMGQDGKLRVCPQDQASEVASTDTCGANVCGYLRQCSTDEQFKQTGNEISEDCRQMGDSDAQRRRISEAGDCVSGGHAAHECTTVMIGAEPQPALSGSMAGLKKDCSSEACNCIGTSVKPEPIRFCCCPPLQDPVLKIAYFPGQFRAVPPEMTSDELKAISVCFSAKSLQELIAEYGCSLVPSEFLLDMIQPDVIANARAFSKPMTKQSFKGFASSLFLDPLNGSSVAGFGDANKTMSAQLKKDNPLMIMAKCISESLMGQNWDVFKGNMLFCRFVKPFSGDEHHCQAEHVDLYAHCIKQARGGIANDVDKYNLIQLSSATESPITFLMNMNDHDVTVVVWLKSHEIAIECNLFYARHHDAYHEWWKQQPANRGKGLDHFFIYWTAVVDAHLALRFPAVAAKPIKPKALVLKPWDLLAMHGLHQHSGTSVPGLRLFFGTNLTVTGLVARNLPPYQFEARGPAKTDPSQTSWALAGMTIRFCLSPRVVDNPAGLGIKIRDAITESLKDSMNLRAHLKSVVDLLWKSLEAAVDSGGFQLTTSVLPIACDIVTGAQAVALGAVIGVVCQSRAGERRMVFVGLASRDGSHNSAVMRGAAISGELSGKLKRSHPHIAAVVDDSVVSSWMKGTNDMIFRSIIEMCGEPLGQYFRKNFKEQCSVQRLLTEELRWFMLAIWKMIESVHKLGFRLVKVDLECMAYDWQTDKVQLLQTGYGALMTLDNEAFRSQGRPSMVNRQTTEAVAESRDEGPDRKFVDQRRLRKLEARVECPSDGGLLSKVDALLESKLEVVTMRPPQVRRWWRENMRGREVGQIAGSDMFLTPADDPSKQRRVGDQFIAETLSAGDIHQFVLMIIAWFCPISCRPAMQMAWKKKLLEVVLIKSVVEAEEAMVAFLGSDLGQGLNSFSQPAALGRLANLFVRALHHDTRDKFNLAPSDADFCSLSVFTPQHELELSSKGLHITVKVDVLPYDIGWMKLAAKALKAAGFSEDDLAQQRANPREALLKNEIGKGVGFWSCGVWLPETFGCWYVGILEQGDACGRYVVALQDGSAFYCDGEPCRELPLDWLIKQGTGGAFANGDVEANCNMTLCRACKFVHADADNVKKVWIPMGVKVLIENAPCVWGYKPNAGAGCNRQE